MKEITIIGAGLSGTLLTMNLLRQECNEQIYIRLVDRKNETEMGPAYSTSEDYLLNVPVEKMGAVSNEPEQMHSMKMQATFYLKELKAKPLMLKQKTTN
jgi:uncharacterized NAD(P)/FAD-binding protein YdhS